MDQIHDGNGNYSETLERLSSFSRGRMDNELYSNYTSRECDLYNTEQGRVIQNHMEAI